MGANVLHVQDRLSLPSVHAQSVWTFTAKPEDAILLSEYAIYSISQMQTAIMEAYMPGNVQCVYNSIKIQPLLKWVLQISSALLYLHGSAQSFPACTLSTLRRMYTSLKRATVVCSAGPYLPSSHAFQSAF